MADATQVKKKFTEGAVKFLEEYRAPQLHFSQLFNGGTSNRVQKFTEFARWESREISSRIASPVARNSSGNSNDFKKSTLSTISGIEYHESFNLNQILTEILSFGDLETAQAKLYRAFIDEVKVRTKFISDMFVRSDELLCAQALYNGIQLPGDPDNEINYGRPATSIKDLGAGEYWSNPDADIETHHKDAMVYFNTIAKFGGAQFDETMSTADWLSFKNSDFYKNEMKNIQFSEIQRQRPDFNENTGSAYMGTMTIAGRVVNFWVNDETYHKDGVGETRYFPEGYIVITPVGRRIGELTDFPMDILMKGTPQMVAKGIHSWEAIHPDSDTLVQHMKTRKVPILYYEKSIYTIKVKA